MVPRLLGGAGASSVLAVAAILSKGSAMKVGLTSGLLVALLAACTAPRERFVAPRLGEIGDSRQGGMLVVHEASDGLVPVAIRGDAFAGRLANPNALVADSLRLPPGFARASFVRTVEAEAGRGQRLVLVFDAEDPNLEVRRLCRDLNSVEVGEPDGRLTIAAAYCIGERVARGAAGATTRPRAMNEEFKRFLDRVLNEVFPFHMHLRP